MNIDVIDKQINELVKFLIEYFPNVKIQIESDSDPNGRPFLIMFFKICTKNFSLADSLDYDLDRSDIIERTEKEIGIIIHKWDEEFRNYLLSLKQ